MPEERVALPLAPYPAELLIAHTGCVQICGRESRGLGLSPGRFKL